MGPGVPVGWWCGELLIEDPGLLDEFAEGGALDHADVFLPMLRAVGRMRPIQARILRDTPEHTICFDVDSDVFHHFKSFTEPLGLKMGRPYPVVEMMMGLLSTMVWYVTWHLYLR